MTTTKKKKPTKRVRNAKRATRMKKKPTTQERVVVASKPSMPEVRPIKSARKLAKKGARLLAKVSRKAKATVKSTRARVKKKKAA